MRKRSDTPDLALPVNRAHQAVWRAKRSGVLVIPDTCSKCGSTAPLEAAHHDYSKPLEVTWLCRACHRRWDAKQPKADGQGWRRAPRAILGPEKAAGDAIKRKCRDNWPPITQARLARRLDIDQTAFSRILAGERRAPEGMYERVAAILGCDLTDITSSGIAA